MTLLDRQFEFTNYLVAGFPEFGLRGYPLDGACPITGNATQENLCNPVTTGAKDHGSDGIMQWRLGRLTELQAWCTKNFGDWRTLKAQAAFTIYETQRDYPELDTELRKGLEGVRPEDARKVLDYKTERFCFEFERPNRALAGLANRQRHAASVYMIMSGSKPPVVAPKPRMPPIVANGGVIVAGGAASSGAVIAASGGSDILAYALIGIALAIAAVAAFLARAPKIAPLAVRRAPARTPQERLASALEGLVLAKAEVAEAVEEVRDNVQKTIGKSAELLIAAGETTITIDSVLEPQKETK